MAQLQQQLQQQREPEEFYDSDEEGLHMPTQRISRKATRIQENSTNAPVSPRFHTSHTQIEPSLSAQQGNNKYYPDVLNFYGDRTQWEFWQLYLEAKFRASGLLYSTDQLRIDYIRDHCKSTAFDVIKARCSKLAVHPYVTSEEVLKDLNNMFGEFDAYETADTRLHDPDFNITSNETFEKFLARYTATVAPLQLRESQQISNLRRTITSQLRWQITNGYKPTSFQAYVQ